MTVHGQQVSRDFILSGWWGSRSVFNVSIMVVSRAYMEEHIEELYSSIDEDSDMTGVINSYLMFRNSWNLEEKWSASSRKAAIPQKKGAWNYIANNVNWSYLSASFQPDAPTVIGVIAALLLIIFTGYLIIYNIFQISVIKDIRFYGLLKTIGTTGKQIRKLIRRQALILSCIGIPIGLILGYLIGCKNRSDNHGSSFRRATAANFCKSSDFHRQYTLRADHRSHQHFQTRRIAASIACRSRPLCGSADLRPQPQRASA